MNINQLAIQPSKVSELTAQLSASLRKPTRKTMALLDKALSYLTPFESPKASPTSPSERADLLTMISTHRWALCPYLDLDRIESNLRRALPPLPFPTVPRRQP